MHIHCIFLYDISTVYNSIRRRNPTSCYSLDRYLYGSLDHFIYLQRYRNRYTFFQLHLLIFLKYNEINPIQISRKLNIFSIHYISATFLWKLEDDKPIRERRFLKRYLTFWHMYNLFADFCFLIGLLLKLLEILIKDKVCTTWCSVSTAKVLLHPSYLLTTHREDYISNL